MLQWGNLIYHYTHSSLLFWSISEYWLVSKLYIKSMPISFHYCTLQLHYNLLIHFSLIIHTHKHTQANIKFFLHRRISWLKIDNYTEVMTEFCPCLNHIKMLQCFFLPCCHDIIYTTSCYTNSVTSCDPLSLSISPPVAVKSECRSVTAVWGKNNRGDWKNFRTFQL